MSELKKLFIMIVMLVVVIWVLLYQNYLDEQILIEKEISRLKEMHNRIASEGV